VNGRISAEEGIQEILENESKPENTPYSLIFVDINMPEVSGLECTK
jgi:CheY-like chemotaxis protein